MGAFTDNELYKWMDENRVRYVLGMKDNHSLLSKRNSFEPKHRASSKEIRGAQISWQKRKKAKNKRLKEISSTYDKDKRQQVKTRIRTPAGAGVWRNQLRARSWDRERRVIARCDYTDSGLEVRYVVTNLQDIRQDRCMRTCMQAGQMRDVDQVNQRDTMRSA
ncbi:MAG: transposase [Candidatus Obscuribacter sp.]|nr:transposase [Candidatus Obscuribacter sp.]